MFKNLLGPPLTAKFVIANNQITTITLTPHSKKTGFEWTVNTPEGSSKLIDKIGSWIEDYCNKKEPTISLPIALEQFTPYTTHVLQALQRIPFGSFMTYKELATTLGNEKAARAVGGACGRNPCLLVIPCHRVLAHGGALGGFSAGLEIKKILLEFESTNEGTGAPRRPPPPL